MLNEKKFLKSNGINDKITIEHLTALWALNECALGGIVHAFKLPFTVFFVGGISELLITLIALSSQKIFLKILKH
ncbi:hypothetical protein SAMN05421876_11631 [Kaistella jeonii]|uniref:Uncharacterized protein n=1 Tax=Kaistella jeonii TaxID=266749 RepID=A0A0C1FDH2_9FLAO|nr:hypothetical protein OA86_13980 [Kaistella jeonii]SFC36696.1 hypothetical protein SAMN05421876_11631 [Kaistella jeonii]VEI97288.1 Uncharacterised protein [Kaistella jeonii]